MKTNIKTLIVILTVIFTSCSDKDCIELPDPNTQQSSCDKGLLVIGSALDNTNMNTEFSLDSISKPISSPLTISNITTDVQQSFFNVTTRPSNYDAYDAVTDTYFIEFPLEQRCYLYDVSAASRQEFIVAGFYAAPVFHNSTLYALEVDFNNFGYATDPAVFEIETINQSDGSTTAIASGTFPLLSRFDWESMSSAIDGNGNLYFVSGTNLVSFNTQTLATNHTELVPTFDSVDNNQQFIGLEYRNNGNLLAIRNRNDALINSLDLVEIDLSNPTNPTVLYDFTANSINLNIEFYSTTYDPCDDSYYITNIDSVTNTSTFYEIDLSTNQITTESLPVYAMGIATKNN